MLTWLLPETICEPSGCSSELDYTEQTSWLLFLKYLDDLEIEKAQRAELVGKSHEFILDAPHRWSAWAAPKNLPPHLDIQDRCYLKGFKARAGSADTIECKIGEIFDEISNKFRSGYSLRDALDLIDGLRFRSQQEKHELSDLYETRIKKMGNAGRNLGKTNPLNDADLAEFIALQKTKADSPKSWRVNVAAIDPKTFDLSVKNPDCGEEIAHRSPQEIMAEIAALDAESAKVLAGIRRLLE